MGSGLGGEVFSVLEKSWMPGAEISPPLLYMLALYHVAGSFFHSGVCFLSPSVRLKGCVPAASLGLRRLSRESKPPWLCGLRGRGERKVSQELLSLTLSLNLLASKDGDREETYW